MITARRVLVSIVVMVLVAALSNTSFGRGSHGGHRSHHRAHHSARHRGRHRAHHEAHPEGDHEAHHEAHHDSHHSEQLAHHDPHQSEQFAHHEHQPWGHSWHRATASELTSWFGGWGWTNPLYYDYGPAGNVVYRNNDVYINGSRANTAGEYAKSALALANVSPSSESPSGGADWLPLGSFALSRQGNGDKPSQTLQLAVNKSGAISGDLHDATKDTSVPVHGSVDRATQRAAFTLGDKAGVVAETGIYNLTRDNATLLMHQGSEKPQYYSLTRLQSPTADKHDLTQSEK